MFPCEEKIQRHKLVFERSFQELFVDYYYTSLQEVVQLSAIVIAYKRMIEDGEVSYDPINLQQYIHDEDIPLELFTPDSPFIPALSLSELTKVPLLRGLEEVEDQLKICHGLVRSVTEEACKELAGIFEYQLSVLSDQASVETVGRHAAERAIEYLRSGNRFVERDSIIEGVAYLNVDESPDTKKTQFVSAIFGDERELKWDVFKMFSACGIRHYDNNQHYYNYDTSGNPNNVNWDALTYRTNISCDPLTYGYRGVIFKKDIESQKNVISQTDLNLYSDVVVDFSEDIHRYYDPIDVKKNKALIHALFRHPSHHIPLRMPHSPTSSCSSRQYNRLSSSFQPQSLNGHFSHPHNISDVDSGRLSKQSGIVITTNDNTRCTLVPDNNPVSSNDSGVVLVNGGDAYRNRYTYSMGSQSQAFKYDKRLNDKSQYAYDSYSNQNGHVNTTNGHLCSPQQRPESHFVRNSRITQSYNVMHPSNAYNRNTINIHQNLTDINPANPYRNFVRRRPAQFSPNDLSPISNAPNVLIETSFDHDSDKIIVNELIPNGSKTNIFNGFDEINKAMYSENRLGLNEQDTTIYANDENSNNINNIHCSNNSSSNYNKTQINQIKKLPPKPPQRTISSRSSNINKHINSSNAEPSVKNVFVNGTTVNDHTNGSVPSRTISCIQSNGGTSSEKNDFLDFSSFLKLVQKQNANLQSFGEKIEAFKNVSNPINDKASQIIDKALNSTSTNFNGHDAIDNINDSFQVNISLSPSLNRPNGKLAFSNV